MLALPRCRTGGALWGGAAPPSGAMIPAGLEPRLRRNLGRAWPGYSSSTRQSLVRRARGRGASSPCAVQCPSRHEAVRAARAREARNAVELCRPSRAGTTTVPDAWQIRDRFARSACLAMLWRSNRGALRLPPALPPFPLLLLLAHGGHARSAAVPPARAAPAAGMLTSRCHEPPATRSCLPHSTVQFPGDARSCLRSERQGAILTPHSQVLLDLHKPA